MVKNVAYHSKTLTVLDNIMAVKNRVISKKQTYEQSIMKEHTFKDFTGAEWQ